MDPLPASLDALPLPVLALLRLLAFLGAAPVDPGLLETPEAGPLFQDAVAAVAAERSRPVTGATVPQALAEFRASFGLTAAAEGLSLPGALHEEARAHIPAPHRLEWIQRSLRLLNAYLPAEADDPRSWERYRRMEPHLAGLLELADREGISDPTGYVMGEKLGVYRFLTGQVEESERLFRRALAIDEAHLGPDHPQVAVDLTNLAVCLESTGRDAETEALYVRTVDILMRHQEAEAGRFAIALGNLARTVARHGQFDEAENLYRQALAIDEAHHGRHHHATAMRLRLLADLLLQHGRPQEGIALLRRALEADEKAGGADHPFVALDLRALLGALSDAEPPEGLVPLAARVLDIDDRWSPDDDTLLVQDRLALADLLERSGQSPEAVRCYRGVLEQYRKQARTNPTIAAAAAAKLAELTPIDPDPDGTLELLRETSAVMLRERGADNPGALALRKSLAKVLRHRGVHAEARQIELDDRERQLRSRVEHSPRDAKALNDLAIFLKNERNDFDGAERGYRQALELAPDDATTLSNLALLLTSVRGLHDEAEHLYRRALELAPHDASALGNLASFVQNIRRQPDVAEGLYRLALAAEPNEPAILANYASLLVVQGQLDAAEPLIAKAWQQQVGRYDRLSARPLVLKAIVETLRGRDPSIYLGQLKTLFVSGIAHVQWPSGGLSDEVRGWMTPEDAAFYNALLKAIDDYDRLDVLHRFETWRRQAPVPLDHPWERAGA